MVWALARGRSLRRAGMPGGLEALACQREDNCSDDWNPQVGLVELAQLGQVRVEELLDLASALAV
jgi:hypothetical protein